MPALTWKYIGGIRRHQRIDRLATGSAVILFVFIGRGAQG